MRLVVAILISARVAAADPSPDQVTPAAVLFEQGLKLLSAGDAAGACAKLEAVLQLEPDAVGAMLNLGFCHEQLDQLATALKWLRKVEALALEGDLANTQAAAKDKAAQLAAKVPHIEIALSRAVPPGVSVRVTVDGGLVAPVDYPRVELDAGKHVVAISGTGGGLGNFASSQDVPLVDGDAKVVQLVIPEPPAPPPPPPKKVWVEVDRGVHRRKAALWVGVAGGVLLGGDLALGLTAKQQYDATERPDVRKQWQDVARYGCTSLTVAGVAAVGVAVWMYVWAPGVERVEQTVVAPAITPRQVGFVLERSF